jgi:opacity protein-like surface antigen
MKKVLIFTLSILLLANIVAAANKPAKISTIVGVIKSIDMNNQSFVMEKSGLMRFLYAFIGLFGSKKSTDITVITSTETEFKKKTTEGVASGVFTDLAVSQRVQVKGTYVTGQTTTTTSTSTSTTTTIITTSQPKIKATSVFILTPVQAAPKKCQTDADCSWCGTNCLKKDSNRVCIQISPPEGYDCKCVNNLCKKVSVTTTTSISTSTTTTIDKTCQEACIAKGHVTGICRQWTVTAKAKMGCNKNETEIGQTNDCTTIVDGQPLLGVGKTCCCSKGKLEATD